MSLILDALRKSEAERRKAQAVSDALAEVPRTPASSLGGVSTWVWPAVALVAVALTVWLWLGRPTDADAVLQLPPAEVGTTEGNTGDPILPEAGAGAGAQDAALGLATAAARDVPPSTTPQRITSTAPTAGNAPRAVTTTLSAATQATTTSSAATAPVAAMPAAAASAPALTVPSAPVRSPPPVPLAPPQNGAASDVAAATSAPLRQPAAPASPSAYPAGSPLRLSDLSTADRQQLPPLKMSMHMWGAEAGKRFAIIDGNRVGEGDRIGDAVVAAIDQDGVVLAWNGIRLRVPVR